jgi:hypothetical protein
MVAKVLAEVDNQCIARPSVHRKKLLATFESAGSDCVDVACFYLVKAGAITRTPGKPPVHGWEYAIVPYPGIDDGKDPQVLGAFDLKVHHPSGAANGVGNGEADDRARFRGQPCASRKAGDLAGVHGHGARRHALALCPPPECGDVHRTRLRVPAARRLSVPALLGQHHAEQLSWRGEDANCTTRSSKCTSTDPQVPLRAAKAEASTPRDVVAELASKRPPLLRIWPGKGLAHLANAKNHGETYCGIAIKANWQTPKASVKPCTDCVAISRSVAPANDDKPRCKACGCNEQTCCIGADQAECTLKDNICSVCVDLGTEVLTKIQTAKKPLSDEGLAKLFHTAEPHRLKGVVELLIAQKRVRRDDKKKLVAVA